MNKIKIIQLVVIVLVAICQSTKNRVLKLLLDVSQQPQNNKNYLQCGLFFTKPQWNQYIRRDYDTILLKDQCDLFIKTNNYTFNFGFPITHGQHHVKIEKPPSFVQLYNTKVTKVKNINQAGSDQYSGGIYKKYSFQAKIVFSKTHGPIRYNQCFQLVGQSRTDRFCFVVNIYNEILIKKVPKSKTMVIKIAKDNYVNRNVYLYLYNPYLTQSCQWYMPDHKKYLKQKLISLGKGRKIMTSQGRFDHVPSSSDMSYTVDGWNFGFMVINKSFDLKLKYICMFNVNLRNTELNLKFRLT